MMFTMSFAVNLIFNALIAGIAALWVNYIGRKVIKAIDQFELKLEKEFVKKIEFFAAIADAKEGRKNLWEEGRSTSEKMTKAINDYAMQFTKEIAIIQTKLEMKERKRNG